MKNQPLELAKKMIPVAIQIVVVAVIVITAYAFYNMGAKRSAAGDRGHAPGVPANSHVEGSAPFADARPPASSHPVDLDGDGIIYISPMHPHIQQDEPGHCPICGMELVATRVDDLETSTHGQTTAVEHEERIHHSDHSDTPPPSPRPVDSVHDSHTSPDSHSLHAPAKDEPLGYACAMRCLPPLEEAGKCPICGMEMQPVHEEAAGAPGAANGAFASGDPQRRIAMSPQAAALAAVQTVRVERKHAVRTVRLVGELAVDTSRRAYVSADVGGRLDRLYAEFEGQVVQPGQDLALLYSPELLGVQKEFFAARESLERFSPDAPAGVRRAAEVAVESGRERLRLAGLTRERVAFIEAAGTPSEQVLLQAPIGGTVLERHIEEGEYVAKGGRILTLADLSVLWAEFDAHDSDLPWVRVGQRARFVSPAHPGRDFEGEVVWIDPKSRPATRTTRVRLEVGNPEGHLRPGMYVVGFVEATLLDPTPPLVIPASAALQTGKRAIVYVTDPDAATPTFEGREVTLGPRLDDEFVVLDGVAEGEWVVTNGAFRIDSALQLLARRSMMNPEGGRALTGHEHHGHDAPPGEDAHTDQEAHTDREANGDPAAHEPHPPPSDATPPTTTIGREELARILPPYLEVQTALAADDYDRARDGWETLAGVADDAFDAPFHDAIHDGAAARDIAELRRAFLPISNLLIYAIQKHGNPGPALLRLVHCPMAFDWDGADWLQRGEVVDNPYFGAEMLTCGRIEKEYAAP